MVHLDRSAVDAYEDYIAHESAKSLRRLISAPGSRFAFRHHRWSTPSSRQSIGEFWKGELDLLRRSPQTRDSIEEIILYLARHRREWLEETLRYLPNGHRFDTKVYLICGYDNIVYGEDVAVNLAFALYREDRREAVYYLIHELAHAGYFRYHKMPDLSRVKTTHELVDTVKLLTHLEGMGVTSSLALRREQGGLLDKDYQTLSDEKETRRRVRLYFEKLTALEDEPDRKADSRDLDYFSGGPGRLWYITGCHMAGKIEEGFGQATLRELVRKGHNAFFEAYESLEDPLSLKD
jgi:hypothetical protein